METIDLRTPEGRAQARDLGIPVPAEPQDESPIEAIPEAGRGMSEKQWMAKIVNQAEADGWTCYHTWISVRSEPGFPDLLCLRGPQMLVIEAKVGKNKPTLAQGKWLAAFGRVPGCTALVAYPHQWAEIQELLR